MSLRDSKYAPKTPLEELRISKAEKLKQAKAKTTRLFQRLQWKGESLLGSYRRASEILQAEAAQNGDMAMHMDAVYPFMGGTDSKQAEAMFKVDFFEFYTLLERYIFISLEIVGVHVSGYVPLINNRKFDYNGNMDLHSRKPMAGHAFHANLLEALDDTECPLHESFGNQHVRIQLGLAKDYRNAWKDADEKVGNTSSHTSAKDAKGNARLEDLDLYTMLQMLLAGCEHAQIVVQAKQPADMTTVTSRDFEPRTDSYESYGTVEMQDMPYEYMDDAMDLD